MYHKEHAVVIAGAGPTGLMLAAELALAQIDVALVERLDMQQHLNRSRAGGLHSRTIEILDQRGIADRFLREGQTYPETSFAGAKLDLSDVPTRHNYLLGLAQKHSERILAGWVDELGVRVYRGDDVTGFTQDDDGVDVALANGGSLRARYLVGCDGGRSIVRKAVGIAFEGADAITSTLMAEVEMSEEPPWGLHYDAAGVHAFSRGDDGTSSVFLVVREHSLRRGDEPALAELREALVDVYGKDFGVHSPAWISRFTDAARQASTYRDRRVLLAGDAAHIHPPTGGQGLNIGVQDAMNLGWKLAQVIKGTSPESLLDSYHAERHPVGARVVRDAMTQMFLARKDDRVDALRDIISELLSMDEPRNRFAAMISGLGVHYELGDGHPLLGRRMPDLDIVTGTGSVRIFSLLHDARPVFLNFGEPHAVDIAPWRDRVKSIDAAYEGTWQLPVFGTVAAPSAVLIRPDGYVAWVGDGTQRGLSDALTTWFGPPSS